MKKFFMFLVAFSLLTGCLNKDVNNDKLNIDGKVKTEPKLQIIDLESNSRPIAVMINNHPTARPNHAGLQEAYLTYEIIVEGGFTRYMALYKDKDLERIGSVRSARHYFLDYALENDAIYVHYGWSPKSITDINEFNVANINGLSDSGFWRDKSLGVPLEHTAFTSIKGIKEVYEKKKYRSTSDKEALFDYSITAINLNEKEESIVANEVVVEYSAATTTSYNYDAEKKVYNRFVNNKTHTDGVTKKQYTVKNIIVINVSNVALDSSGRQDLKNIGSGNGYYITNGYAMPIKWEKGSRSSQTVYKYLNGEEIKLNDGNTFIQIQPINKNTKIN